ncbi:MAG: hypothetical protein HY049_01705 [Acidobacteria bacterium]|nr:hypothetical protein [Acidobacteriota bacterium]
MTRNHRARLAVAALAALALSGGGLFANCLDFGGFAIFQCADVAYFNPPPVAVAFDPNNKPTNVTAVFWQLGFGNNQAGHCDLVQLKCTSGLLNKACSSASLPTPDTFCNANTGLGSSGTGNSALNDFNGNDTGIFAVDVRDARVTTGQPGVPAGSLCLSSNNWANSGVDGCADDLRNAALAVADDGDLNPYYDVNFSRTYSAKGYYSLSWQQDYPMAALLETAPDARYFAIAAVATLNRGNTGGNGPCAPAGQTGTNAAACDVRPGFYSFKDVANGVANPFVVGKFNVIPWQQVPKPSANCVANCASSPRSIRFDWAPVIWYHDRSIRPSTNPGMAPTDATRAPGVGVLDLLRKTDAGNSWQGLIHYDLESATATAANLDANGRLIPASLAFSTAVADVPQPAIDANTGNPTAPTISSTVAAGPDTCWRVRVKFGKKPETSTTSTANCRLGKCGDRGYDAVSLDGATITCVGGALFSQAFTSVTADKSQGKITVAWSMSAELSITGYNVYALNAKGARSLLTPSPINCTECSSGLSASYQVTFSAGKSKGARSIIVEALGGSVFSSNPVPVQ